MDVQHTYPPARQIIIDAMQEKGMSKRGLARALQAKLPDTTFESMHANVKRWTRDRSPSSPGSKFAPLLADILDVPAASLLTRRESLYTRQKREIAELQRRLAEAEAQGGASS